MSQSAESILRGAREALDYARGRDNGAVAHVPEHVDVRAVRQKLGLSQAKFAARFGFSINSIRNWEQGRRQPDVAHRAFLAVIDCEPQAVRRALTVDASSKRGKRAAKRKSAATA
ncbi:MAG: helix-turn-helix domain-containing protein [Gammaproteobacteria bacterium]|nr:helix-turn-helix domain-containing protein [Gammaproteobacteria bacterium]